MAYHEFPWMEVELLKIVIIATKNRNNTKNASKQNLMQFIACKPLVLQEAAVSMNNIHNRVLQKLL